MWNERYSSSEYVFGTEPNNFLVQHYRSIPKGQVLCLGEGEGRNAVFLARQGYEVTAVDLSEMGLEKARKLAESNDVSLTLIQADLAEFDLGQNAWDGVVSIFCHLPSSVRGQLHKQIRSALKPNGVYLLEAYTPKQLTFGTGGPPDEDRLVDADDLRNELQGLDFEWLQETEREVIEGTHHIGQAAVVQAVSVKPLRRYQVSSNRGSAIHKVRYVESGGGEADENCRVCQPSPKPRD